MTQPPFFWGNSAKHSLMHSSDTRKGEPESPEQKGALVHQRVLHVLLIALSSLSAGRCSSESIKMGFYFYNWLKFITNHNYPIYWQFTIL